MNVYNKESFPLVQEKETIPCDVTIELNPNAHQLNV